MFIVGCVSDKDKLKEGGFQLFFVFFTRWANVYKAINLCFARRSVDFAKKILQFAKSGEDHFCNLQIYQVWRPIAPKPKHCTPPYIFWVILNYFNNWPKEAYLRCPHCFFFVVVFFKCRIAFWASALHWPQNEWLCGAILAKATKLKKFSDKSWNSFLQMNEKKKRMCSSITYLLRNKIPKTAKLQK